MSEKTEKRRTSAGDMLAAFLITFALACFSYEKYMPESFMKIYNAVIFIIFAAVWVGLSFKNGYGKKLAFPVFALLFWIVPPLIILLAENGPEFCRMSITMYILSEFAGLIVTLPAEITGGVIGISAVAAGIVIVLLCAAGYLSGMYLSEKKPQKHHGKKR